MRPRERRETSEQDLFRSRLDQIIDMKPALVKLSRAIDWGFLEQTFGAVYTDKPGQPPLPTRLMAGLAILKHAYDLSDEALCDRWVENPYFQYFCGEEFFQHALVFDRSSLTRWRQRMGEDKLKALLQESLAVATRTEAMKPSDLARVVIDTTVQPKAVMFPTDAKLLNRARERLVRLTKKLGVSLRQSYARVGKLALIKHQRYAHAHQFKRANRSLRKLKTYLGRVIRDIERRIVGNEDLREAFVRPLFLARRVLEQERRQRGRKVSVATPVKHSAGGQFVTHAAALPGNPYDGHTLATVIPQMQALIGNVLDRCITDAGYRGHNAPPDHKFKVYTSGQKRRVTPQIKREFKRRAAIEPVTGHLNEHHHMGRNYLAHASGDATNAVLAAVGYNFRHLLAWLSLLLLRILIALGLTAKFKLA